jgi:hypothetical protein
VTMLQGICKLLLLLNEREYPQFSFTV